MIPPLDFRYNLGPMSPAAASIPFLLRQKLDEIRSRNPAFSLRAFARKLDVHPAALSEILSGKRVIAGKLASRIAASPVLDEREQEQILALATRGRLLGKLGKRRLDETSPIDLDHYFLVSEWYYYAILSLAETRGFKSSPRWISKRLGLDEALVRRAIERLIRLGYFKRGSRGKLSLRRGLRLSTTEDVVSASLKKRHASNLQSAQRALEQVPVELRELTFMTMAIDLTKLPEAKLLMREFREKLCAFLEDGTKSEVYELCLSLFPRTVVKATGSDA